LTEREFFDFCTQEFGTMPDYPFEGDFETAVLRHKDSRKWYAIVMHLSRRKFGQNSDGQIAVVNLKLPPVMAGSFGPGDGVYPAYHMNKLHWVSLILPDASVQTAEFLTRVSFELTQSKKKVR